MRYTKLFWVKLISSAIIFVLSAELLHAQNGTFNPQFYAQKSQKLQKKGMIFLGSWATLNIFSGSAGYFLSEGEVKYIHQMNAGWNLVNVGIAGLALHSLSHSDASSISYSEAQSKLQNLDKILLLNTGLDVGYMATGAWLWERGIRKDSRRLIGYGKSLIIQGGFLLAFDLVLYLIHSPITSDLIMEGNQIELTANGIRINF